MSQGLKETSFFIGANSHIGFENLTSQMADGLKRLYIIKGGPGTGKSTMLRLFARAANDAGYKTELYYCSSDSSSLDGVSVPELGVGIIDGTAPHTAEPTLIGAYETIINIGEHLNEDYLVQMRPYIEGHSKAKKELFSRAYRYISLIASLHREGVSLVTSCADIEKAKRAAERLASSFGVGSGYSEKRKQISSLGMNGVTYLDSYALLSESCIYIQDKRNLSGVIMNLIHCALKERGHEMWVSENPYGECEAIYLPSKKTAIISHSTKEECKIINTERFILREKFRLQRGRLRLLTRLKKELKGVLFEIFKDIANEHFALENIYKEAVDFQAVERLTDELIHKALKTT